MDQLSPWYQLYQFAPPHFPFCGRILNGYIADPVDTFTSIFYFFIGLYLYRMSRREPKSIQKHFYIITFIVTLGSILFHMSFSYVLLMADFLGIFILSFYSIGLNLIRLGQIKKDGFYQKVFLAGLLYLVTMVISYQVKFHSGILMIPLILLTLLTEIQAWRKDQQVNYKYLILTTISLSLGYICMLLEGAPFRVGCYQTAYYLHSFWHLLSALSFVFIFKFYQQFKIQMD